jgi:hypothetical protein
MSHDRVIEAWKDIERVHDDVHTALGIEDDEEDRQEALQRIFTQGDVTAVLFEHEEPPPPYYASLYINDRNDEEHPCFLGTVWRDDRWPTVEEVTAAIAHWGSAPPIRVTWWAGAPDAPMHNLDVYVALIERLYAARSKTSSGLAKDEDEQLDVLDRAWRALSAEEHAQVDERVEEVKRRYGCGATEP